MSRPPSSRGPQIPPSQSSSTTPPPPPPPPKSTALLPSALPKDDSQESEATEVPTAVDYTSTAIAGSTTTETEGEASLLATKPPPPHFTPFFTLIEDASTNEHYHPTVHYIFSDDPVDDHDLVTQAALRILEGKPNPNTTSSSPERDPQSPESPAGKEEEEEEDREQSSPNGPPSLAPARPDTNERYILLQLEPDGTKIHSAHSMTSDWQILNAEISPAPTLDGQAGAGAAEIATEGGNGDEEMGLMLRVEGTEGPRALSEEEGRMGMGMEELVEMFGKRMEELRRVVGVRGPGDGRE